MPALVVAPASFLACGVCTYWILRTTFPAVLEWTIIFPVWFLLLAVIGSVSRRRLPWVPQLWIVLLLVGGSAYLGLVAIGPLAAFWIPIPCILGTAGLFRDAARSDRPSWVARTVSGVGLAAILSLAATAAFGYWRDAAMSPVERALAFQYSVVFDHELSRLEAESEDPCRDLVEVAERIDESYSWPRVKKHLQEACDPAAFEAYRQVFEDEDGIYRSTKARRVALSDVLRSSLSNEEVGDTFDWEGAGALDLLDRLRADLREGAWFYTVNGEHRDWVREEEIPDLLELVDSTEPCGGVVSVFSSWLPEEPSTIGREARFLVEGFRSGVYPPGIASQRYGVSADDLRAWWKDRSSAEIPTQ